MSEFTAAIILYFVLGLFTLPIARHFKLINKNRLAPVCVVLLWPFGIILAGLVAWFDANENKKI